MLIWLLSKSRLNETLIIFVIVLSSKKRVSNDQSRDYLALEFLNNNKSTSTTRFQAPECFKHPVSIYKNETAGTRFLFSKSRAKKIKGDFIGSGFI